MKEYAIREDHLYRKAYAKGKKAQTGTVSVYILKDYKANRLRKENPQKQYINRIGLTVTKKLGGAVVRNRTKRVIREAYRHVKSTYKLKTGFLVVIVAHISCTRSKTQDVARDLHRAFEKLGFVTE